MADNKSKYPHGWYSIIAKNLNMNRGKVRYQLINNTESPEIAQELEILLVKRKRLEKLKQNYNKQ